MSLTLTVTQNVTTLNLTVTQDTNVTTIQPTIIVAATTSYMLKSIYDTDGNGVVDDAEKVNGLTVETAVPSGALFTDTVYDDTLVAKKNISNTFTENQTIDGSIKIGDDTSVASSLNEGSHRYRKEVGGSFADMCMQISDTLYEWVNIVYNIYNPTFYNDFYARVIALGGTVIGKEFIEGYVDETSILTMIPVGGATGVLASQVPTDGVGDFTVDRNSPVWAMGKEGVLVETPANVPVFEWENGKPHLLTQPQATNLVLWSEEISNFGNFINGSGLTPIIVDNVSISPDGTQNASSVKLDLGVGGNLSSSNRSLARSNLISYSSGEDVFTSIFLKAKNPIDIGKTVRINFEAPGFTQLIYSLTSEWVEIKLSSTVTDTGASNFYVENRGLFTNSDIVEFYMWGANLKENESSYIPTNGTTVTRLQDVITVTPPLGVTEITETIDGVEQTPITVIPVTYTIPFGKINKIVMT